VGEKGGEVESQRVAHQQIHVRARASQFGEDRRQALVELHRYEPPAAVGQAQGQRSESRADLQDLVVGLNASRFDDAVAQVGVDEEVLTQAVAGAEPVPGQHCRELAAIGWIEPVQLART
jgi:hypothetical protein